MMVIKKKKLTMIDFLNIYTTCISRTWLKNQYY